MSMNFVDVAMIGRVGPTALAAVSLGSAVFLVFAIVCEGMMMGSDAMVSQDFGAGRIEECFRTLWAGAQLALPLGVLCALLVAASARLLSPMGIAPQIVRQAIPFLYAMACGLPAQILLCRHARLSAGDAPRARGGLRHGLGQPGQPGGQLRAHLRTLGTARAGRHGLGPLHGTVARLHDVRAAGLPALAQPARAPAPGAIRGPLLPGPHREHCAPGRAGRGADRARGRRVFRRHAAGRAAGRGGRQRTPDRPHPRSRSPSWCRWAWRRPPRCA